MQRRSFDDGTTWGPMSTVVDGTVPCKGCPAAISNPNPAEIKLADGKMAVLLAYDTMNNPSGKRHGLDKHVMMMLLLLLLLALVLLFVLVLVVLVVLVLTLLLSGMQIWSFDDGDSWQNASVVSYPPAKNVGASLCI